MEKRVATPKTISYFVLSAAFLLVVYFHLGPALLAGFFSYLVLDFIYRPLSKILRPFYARWISLAVFIVVSALMVGVILKFVGQSLAAVPVIMANSLPRLNELSLQYGFDLAFTNMEEMLAAVIEALKQNAGKITKSSQILTGQFFHVLIGCSVALLSFMDTKREAPGPNLFDELRIELSRQIGRFTDSFERVMGAQVAISAINTCLTGVFLLSMDFPYLLFLVLATFLLGMIPIVGNLMSNTVVVFTGLTLSPEHAFFALCFLIVIHKGEYFLNSKIVGANIRTPMWQTLLGILLGHVVMGVPGIMLAPALLYYVRSELREVRS